MLIPDLYYAEAFPRLRGGRGLSRKWRRGLDESGEGATKDNGFHLNIS